MTAVPHCQELLEALRAADGSSQESPRRVGPFLVWSLRGSTYHPLLTETFPDGLIMVSSEDGGIDASWGNADARELHLAQAVHSCCVQLPIASGPCEEPPAFEHCKSAPKAVLGSAAKAMLVTNTCGSKMEYSILEDRLKPLDMLLGRQLLSALSQHKVCLNLPLVVAVREESSGQQGANSQPPALAGDNASGCSGCPARTLFLGVRTRPVVNDENEAPTCRGLHVLESIRVLRPWLATGERLIIGDLLRHFRGLQGRSAGRATGKAPGRGDDAGAENGQQSVEVRMRLRYDHRLGKEDVHEWASPLPAELLPGPFISLVYSWPMSLQQAMSTSLLELGSQAGATVLVRGSYCAERSPLGRYLHDLDLMRFLAPLSAGTAEAAPFSNINGSSFAPPLRSEAEIIAAVAQFLEDERRLATVGAQDVEMPASQAETRLGTTGTAFEKVAGDLENEARPSRDFVDRLWLKVFARCQTPVSLTLAVRCTLQELGQPGGIAPAVRRENPGEMAELARAAVKISTLQRYGTVSESQKLQESAASWESRCAHFSETEHALPLVLGAGMECLRQDFLHMITRCGYITAADLSFFADTSLSTHTQLERLQCLQRVAELAVLCTRYRLPLDTLRQLILKSVEYYQRDENARGDKVPVFSVPLGQTSGARFFASFPSTEASSIVLQCGAASIRAERVLRRKAGLFGAQEAAQEAGFWAPTASDSPFEYRVTLIDRYGYHK